MLKTKKCPVGLINPSLCHGCGLCAGACPTNALRMEIVNGQYLPIFSQQKCTNCGLCEKVCHREEIDLTNFICSLKGGSFHPYIGYFRKCYTGFSADPVIRKKSASGGLISSLLTHLLESEEIDGAVVTKLKFDGQNIVTYPFIAKDKKEILSASGSHYLPVNFSQVLKKILQSEGRYAVVALPCVISNLAKAKRNLPAIDRKIKYLFGMFCSQNFNYSVLDFIKNKINFPEKSEIISFNFRSEWPDSIIELKTSEEKYKLHPKDWNFLFTLKMYSMNRCLTCDDSLAELADISFGDAWLPRIKKADKLGTNICVSRTKEGEKLLYSAKKDGLIHLNESSATEVVDSQKFSIYFKKVQGKYLRKKADEKFHTQLGVSSAKLIPQFLFTVPPSLLLSRLSNNRPELMAKIPSSIYKVIFYFVSLGVLTWYKWGIDKIEVSKRS